MESSYALFSKVKISPLKEAWFVKGCIPKVYPIVFRSNFRRRIDLILISITFVKTYYRTEAIQKKFSVYQYAKEL